VERGVGGDEVSRTALVFKASGMLFWVKVGLGLFRVKVGLGLFPAKFSLEIFLVKLHLEKFPATTPKPSTKLTFPKQACLTKTLAKTNTNPQK
tara:strand:- start:42 stop:320 length:279 start_codon:yes stop_codon:yes gene_type:complete